MIDIAAREVSMAAAGLPEPPAELDRRVIAAADAGGLLDVAYGSIDTPVGRLFAATTRRGLVRVAFTWEEDEVRVLMELARQVSPRIMEAPEKLAAPRRELDEYFAGRRSAFDLPLDWTLIHGFHREVLEVTNRIPFGRVSNYSEVAADAGRPRASRAAGNALGSNPIPIVIPCHRVLRRDGSLGGYGGGLDVKRYLLRLEGVTGLA